MKRIFDLLIASLALMVLALPFIALAFQMQKKIGSPILFRQLRPGLRCIPFELIKFRTMNSNVGSDGNLLSDAERLSVFGCWMRSTSLDELPELWNVIKGEMSLVGPRPLLMEYLPYYSERQKRRHDVRPGITGWAQVNGRNLLSWDEKFEMDIWYVENQSLWLDIKILCMTVRKVIIRDGISAQGEATMSRFTGKNSEQINKG